MGGAIPYLAERLDRGYRAFADCRRHINRPPSEYLKTLYYDTVNFNPDAVKFAMSFAGADRILAGSDYPHQIGSIPLMIDTIRGARRGRRREEEDLRGERGAVAGAVSQGSTGFRGVLRPHHTMPNATASIAACGQKMRGSAHDTPRTLHDDSG